MAGNMQPPPPPPGGSSPGPPSGGGGGAKASPTPPEIIILVAGAVMLLGSFLPFYSVSGNEFVRDTDWSAWSNAFSLFPLTVFVMLYGVIAAVHVALSRFAGTDLPNRILGFTWPQLHLVLGFLATLTMLAYLIRGGEITEDVDRGIGFWLMLLGAIGVLVGAVMEQQQSAPADGRFGDAR